MKRIYKEEKDLEFLQLAVRECKENRDVLMKMNEAVVLGISAQAAWTATNVLRAVDTESTTASTDTDAPAGTDAMETVKQVEASAPPVAGAVPEIDRNTVSGVAIVKDEVAHAATGSDISKSTADNDAVANAIAKGAGNSSTSEAAEISIKLGALQTKISELKGSISTVRTRLNRARKEENELNTFFFLSLAGRYHVTEWMSAMQKILWPSNDAEDILGRPVEEGLPIGVVIHMEAAKTLGIQDFCDVLQLEEYFKWMAWCYQCLTRLRSPPKSSELKRLLVEGKKCKMAEEKIVKAVGAMLNRVQ